MGKRSAFERRDRDHYATWDFRAVQALLPHVAPGTTFAEPCAGDGILGHLLASQGLVCRRMSDIHPVSSAVAHADALKITETDADCFITNPPYTRDLMHALITHLAAIAPTWLLIEADWAHTLQAIPFMPFCRKVVSVGRLRWFPESDDDGKDNYAWFLFDNTPTAVQGTGPDFFFRRESMTQDSKIEWTDHTFNPWIGCTKVSPGCRNCYAESGFGMRFGIEWGPGRARRRTSGSTWKEPLRWNRKAEREGRRYRVFCASLADVFDPEVPDEWRSDLFDLINATPHLDWLLLTKRPEVMTKYFQNGNCPNIWLGVTVENQEQADKRIPILLNTPAAVRFLSIEPLLGPVHIERYLWGKPWRGELGVGREVVDWVIVGGESGHKARPIEPAWVRNVRDQCAAAGTPFLFKQWGEFAPYDRGRIDSATLASPGSTDKPIQRFGKTMSGRHLDGRTHDDVPFPEIYTGWRTRPGGPDHRETHLVDQGE